MITETLSSLPSPIAAPLAMATPGNPQRKDMLRFALENIVSLVGAITVGDLLDQIASLEEEAEDGKEAKEGGLLALLSSDESEEILADFQRIGMEQMSLGKWVALLRTMAAFSKKNGLKPELPDALSVYADAKKAVDELVTRRNHDAHGPMIPQDKLDDELNDRSKLLNDILKKLSFLDNWQLSQFDRFEINGSDQCYFGTQYTGEEGATPVELKDSVIPIPVGEPVLIKKDGKQLIRLLPLAIVAPIDGEGNTEFSLYSKEVKKNSNELGFLSVAGSSTVNTISWLEEHGVDLPARRQSFERLFKSAESINPSVEAALELSTRNLNVGDEAAELTITVRNQKDSTDLESVTAVANLPSTLKFVEQQDSGTLLDERRMQFEWSSMETNSEHTATFMVEAVSQGAENIPPATVSFQYRGTETSESVDEEDNVEVTGPTIQVLDPNSEDALIPIINVHRTLHPADGRTEIEIGDRFEFEVKLENIGLGRASGVETYILVPDGLQVLDGPEHVLVNLAPGESRKMRWSIRARRPGVYQVRICDVVYKDLSGKRHATECSEEYRFLVKSNKRRQFRYAIRDVVSDLQITDEEESQINSMRDGLKEQMPDDAEREALRAAAETDAIIEIVRDSVNGVAREKGIRVKEQVFTETKWQAKYHKERGQRSVLSFVNGDIPFFAIDFTESSDGKLFFHSFDIPGGDRAPFRPKEESLGIYATNRVVNGTLDTCLTWEDMRRDHKTSLPFLKGWIGRCLTRIEKQFRPWESVSSTFAAALGGRSVHRWQRYEMVVPDQTKNNLCIQDIADPSGAYRCCGWVFQAEKDPSRYTLILNMKSGAPGMSKGGVKWVKAQQSKGLWPEFKFYKSLAKKPGHPEPATRDSYWIGCEIEWKSSDDDEVIKTAANQLIDICRRAFAADADKTETATYGKGKTEIPMLSKSESGESWMDQRMEELFDARIGLRMAFTTAAFIKGSLELFMLSDSPATGAPSTSLGRIKTGGGNGELWMNWFEGMDTSLNVANSLVVDAGTWGKPEKVPDAIRKDSLLRIKEETIDQDLFNSWIDGIIAASKSSRIPAWPSFAMDDILAQVNATEPRLANLLKMLEAGPRTITDLREEAGEDGKKLLLTINRLTGWTKRYNKPSPLVPSNEQADAIEINPAYRDLLLTSAS
ncbi:MAG: hypothetical protein MK089_04455 [Phycisphaerales bacterium]|nr:hypothetical protein [Phycisphaerales bacterium]